jgi:hypothetical protein
VSPILEAVAVSEATKPVPDIYSSVTATRIMNPIVTAKIATAAKPSRFSVGCLVGSGWSCILRFRSILAVKACSN